MLYKEIPLPMLLTYIRLIGAPLVLPFLFVYLLTYNALWLNYTLAGIFFLFALTDFFDGYLARKYEQTSETGALLDHVADKFLLYSSLVGLIAAHKLYFAWAIVWIGREFFIMTLRQVALENNFSITVSSYGKIKTALQVCALTIVISNPYHALPLLASYWNIAEFLLLSAATILCVVSAYDYFSVFQKRFYR